MSTILTFLSPSPSLSLLIYLSKTPRPSPGSWRTAPLPISESTVGSQDHPLLILQLPSQVHPSKPLLPNISSLNSAAPKSPENKIKS